MLPLGFRFDVDAVMVGGVAHRRNCRHVVVATAEDVIHVFAGGVHLAEACPRECPSCRPPFETLLTHQLERSLEALIH